jgi:hypothetical protein
MFNREYFYKAQRFPSDIQLMLSGKEEAKSLASRQMCGSSLFLSMALPAHSGPCPFIQFRNHFSQTVGFLGRVISPSQGLCLNTEHKHRINAYTH